MAGGLAALLDDVAMIAKMASSASTKAVGVIVDDAAVTPRYVHGFSPARELPIIWKIAKGSIRNKLLIILPVAMLLSQFAPFLLTPILMLGGTYLCFEGAEKFIEWFHKPKSPEEGHEPVVLKGDKELEDTMVKGAIMTDLILSAEIMVISLNQVASASFWPRLATMIVVAIFLTVLVYGVVALIVKMDDVGLSLSERENGGSQRVGRFLLAAMPKVMTALSTIGVIAMLWVGGHILIDGAHKLGWHLPHDIIHSLSEPVHHVAAVGGALAWLVDTLCSAVVGLVIGSIIAGIVHVLPIHRKDPHH